MEHLGADQCQGALFSVDFLPGRAVFDTELRFLSSLLHSIPSFKVHYYFST